MKRSIQLILLLLAATACDAGSLETDQPQVKESISLVEVSIAPFTLTDADTRQPVGGEGVHRWSSSEKLGILAPDGSNSAFIIRKAFDGVRSGTAEFYGEPVFGKSLTAYLPWNPEGSLEDPETQEYAAEPYTHFMNNSRMSGTLSGNSLSLSCSGGLLKLDCREELGTVESLTIRSVGWRAQVRHINARCGAASPLTVWVKIPSGNYHNFNVTFQCAGTQVSMPVIATVSVKDFDCVSVTARPQSFSDGIDPFQGESGSYTDAPTHD